MRRGEVVVLWPTILEHMATQEKIDEIFISRALNEKRAGKDGYIGNTEPLAMTPVVPAGPEAELEADNPRATSAAANILSAGTDQPAPPNNASPIPATPEFTAVEEFLRATPIVLLTPIVISRKAQHPLSTITIVESRNLLPEWKVCSRGF